MPVSPYYWGMTNTAAQFPETDRRTGRRYRIVKVYRPTGRYQHADRVTGQLGRRYDLVTQFAA